MVSTWGEMGPSLLSAREFTCSCFVSLRHHHSAADTCAVMNIHDIDWYIRSGSGGYFTFSFNYSGKARHKREANRKFEGGGGAGQIGIVGFCAAVSWAEW